MGFVPSTDILKVFSLSYYENVEVFNARGPTNSTHFLYMYEYVGTFCVNASRITGVGHCIVYSCIGLSTTFIVINGNHLHTFCLYTNQPHRRCYGNQGLTMKKSILFLVMAMSMLYCLCSCEKSDNSNDIETEETEEYVELGLSLKGIDISTSPMSTKASSSDLYCVGIYYDYDVTNGNTSGNEYAAWLTDDITSEKIKLRKGKKYQCKVVYFPNGKKVLADYKNGSVYPICGMHLKTPKLEDGVIYDNNYGWGNLIHGAAKKKGDADSGMPASGYYFNDVVRYHGGTIIEANADIEAEVNLYLQMYELNVEVKNFTEGYIDIKSAGHD